ncbi:MAG: methylmalonyl Co-A mutase-associated GTPase MeaB [Lentimicrobium sp.]|jgi:LAO/AO transport system kinase|nr:methylmalonyl Co-A mutase-associated GTPase MeaB [Lentimicrobium sp.]
MKSSKHNSGERPEKSALKVQGGVEQPSSLNPHAVKRFKGMRTALLSVDEYLAGIRALDITILSKAITLVESALPEHQAIARQLIQACLPFAGNSVRIGITGVPGAGKSTFIEAFGMHLLGKGRRLAVLAIDPSSSRSKGSILGDKTRMEELSAQADAYIRPSPSAGSLGGVARKTREIIILCEAAGFDTIFVETVGVGQSETAVHSMVDFFLLLMISGAGDELQGIKRGIMEMADAIAVNKADGDNKTKAQIAQMQIKNALHLFPPTESGWVPEVNTCSALTHDGIADIWEMTERYFAFVKENNYFGHKRQQQAWQIMLDYVDGRLHERFYNHPVIKRELVSYKHKIQEGAISPYQAGADLLDVFDTTD